MQFLHSLNLFCMQDNAMMKNIPPHRDYDGLYQEIHQYSSNAQKLLKIAVSLLIENKRLSQESKKQYSALDQIHILVRELYTILNNKISEVRFLKSRITLLQNSYDAFQKNIKSCSSKPMTTVENSFRSMMSSMHVLNFAVKILVEDYNSILWSTLAKALDEANPYIANMVNCFRNICSQIIEGDSTKTMRKRGKKPIVKNNKAKRSKMQEKSEVSMNNFTKCSNRRKKPNQKEKFKNDDSASQTKNVEVDCTISEFQNTDSANESVWYFNNLKITKDVWELFGDHSKRFSINLIDVLNDPVAECDADVLRYKESNLFKDIKNNEYKVIEDVGTSSNDQKKLSNNTEKNDLITTKTNVQHESHDLSPDGDECDKSGSNTDSQDENNEQESTSMNSDYDDGGGDDDEDAGCGGGDEDEEQHGIENKEKENCEDKETPGSSKSDYSIHGKKGPRTPLTPTISESLKTSPRTPITPTPNESVRMNPQTPPSSPDSLKRGPCNISRVSRTPPSSPHIPEQFRMGPRTPSPPEIPKCLRRGPRTPPPPKTPECLRRGPRTPPGSPYSDVYSSDEDSPVY